MSLVQRYKVWRIELMELEDGEPDVDDDDMTTVVLATDYDMAANDDRGVL